MGEGGRRRRISRRRQLGRRERREKERRREWEIETSRDSGRRKITALPDQSCVSTDLPRGSYKRDVRGAALIVSVHRTRRVYARK